MTNDSDPRISIREQDQSWEPIYKSLLGAEGTSSTETDSANTGLQEWPFDPEQVNDYRYGNNMHSRAIEAKIAATVGLGFVDEKLEDKLDPFCDDDDIIGLLSEVGDDYYGLANGFLEVVRTGSKLQGLHHIPGTTVKIYKENRVDYHYEVTAITGKPVKMARWNDKNRLLSTLGKDVRADSEQVQMSELIHFAQVPSAWNKWYGVPSWLSAIPLIRTVQEVHQYNFDFFKNSAIPELLIMLMNASVSKPDMDKLNNMLQANKGKGKKRKSVAINLPHENIKVDLERLSDGKIDGSFLEMMDRYDLGILSAHGVTPVLVGIQTSPKILGQTKEIRDNLQLLQALTLKPNQRLFTKKLKATLGTLIKASDKTRQKQVVSGVTQEMETVTESGWTFKKITDEIEFDMTPQLGGPGNGQNPGQGGSSEQADRSENS